MPLTKTLTKLFANVYEPETHVLHGRDRGQGGILAVAQNSLWVLLLTREVCQIRRQGVDASRAIHTERKVTFAVLRILGNVAELFPPGISAARHPKAMVCTQSLSAVVLLTPLCRVQLRQSRCA